MSPGLGAATVLGDIVYWVELQSMQLGTNFDQLVLVKSAPLPDGGPIAVIGQFENIGVPLPQYNQSAVTSSTVFLVGEAVEQFPIDSGVPEGGLPQALAGFTQNCQTLVSDTDAVYCQSTLGPVTRIASDGSTTTLGMSVNTDGGHARCWARLR